MSIFYFILLLLIASCQAISLCSGDQRSCEDGIVVDKTCYRLLYRSGPKINYQASKDLCNFHGGILAEIPNKETYQAIFSYVKRSWYMESSRNVVQVWLGSVYESNQVFLSTGGKSYITWFPGYPRSTTGHTRMAIELPTNSNHSITSNGMFNIIDSYTAVPLCQF